MLTERQSRGFRNRKQRPGPRSRQAIRFLRLTSAVGSSRPHVKGSVRLAQSLQARRAKCAHVYARIACMSSDCIDRRVRGCCQDSQRIPNPPSLLSNRLPMPLISFVHTVCSRPQPTPPSATSSSSPSLWPESRISRPPPPPSASTQWRLLLTRRRLSGLDQGFGRFT